MSKVFNPDRFGFCVVGDKVVLMEPDQRSMSTRTWMVDRLNISEDDTDIIPRGYMLPGRIQFFAGDYHTCTEVTEDIVSDAVMMYACLYDTTNINALQVPVYNGVWAGAEGETWEPSMKWNFDTGRWERVK